MWGLWMKLSHDLGRDGKLPLPCLILKNSHEKRKNRKAPDRELFDFQNRFNIPILFLLPCLKKIFP